MTGQVHVFLDNPNVYYGAQLATPRPSALHPVRLQFDALLALASAGRPVADAVASCTDRGRNSIALSFMQRAGFRVRAGEPGLFTNREVRVDEELQLEMYKTLAHHEPGVAVLLTGDGAGSGTDGFGPAVRALAQSDWAVELLSWRSSCSSLLAETVEACGGVVEWLDPYWRSITFEQNGRCAEPLSLRSRRRAAAPRAAA